MLHESADNEMLAIEVFNRVIGNYLAARQSSEEFVGGSLFWLTNTCELYHLVQTHPKLTEISKQPLVKNKKEYKPQERRAALQL